MSTRHEKTSGPLSQERYMSSNEFTELRGISGVAVSARAAVLLNTSKKKFIWWLQKISLDEGGLKRFTRELLEMFPDRIGTPDMHKEKVCPGKVYPSTLVDSVERALGLRDVFNNKPALPKPGSALIQLCRDFALRQRGHSDAPAYSGAREIPSMEEFLIDLCVNPRIYFDEPGEQVDFSSVESGLAIAEFSELSRNDFKKANLVYFRDIVGALFEYKTRQEAAARDKFHLTAIGREIWKTLDYAIASRGMVVLDGLEGRGKTQAVKAWCELHSGQARFVSLKGIANKTTAFREIAKALGIASSYGRTATEMQARIEDVLKRSKLMLVVDEAHFVFNQSRRIYSRPELVDWIDTAICNQGIGIALVTTPQFIVCMTRAADQVEWNYRQFRRRVKRWVKLPAVNPEADIKSVARSVFPKADAGMISKIAGYALLSKRDLSAVGDVADEVRAMLESDDLSLAKPEHIQRAIYEFLIPSDKSFLEGMAAARAIGRKTQRRPAPPAMEDSQPEATTPAPGRNAPESDSEILPVPHSRVSAHMATPRSRAGIGELIRA